MGYDENRAAKPFTGTPYQLVRFVWRSYKRWQLRRETRVILSKLSDSQLKDIGLRRNDWNAWNDRQKKPCRGRVFIRQRTINRF